MKELALCAALLSLLALPPRAEAIPVVDMTNFAQNLITAIEAVDQTLAQIEHLKADIEHHETVVDDLIRNGAAPAVYTWDRLNSIHDRLQRLSQGLRFQRLSLQDWLKQFASLDFYRSAPCYGPDLECPKRQWEHILSESRRMHDLASHSRKQTLDDLMKALHAGEETLAEHSTNLHALQLQSQSAEGHMQALAAANQLASAQATQLIEIRSIMYAHYWAVAVQAQEQQAQEARGRALSERYRRQIHKPGERRTRAGASPWRW